MRALSWVSLGGGLGVGDESDDPAPVVPGAVMRFGSPPREWDFPTLNLESSSSDKEVFLSSKRRRRRRRAPPKLVPATASSSSDDDHAPAAAGPACAVPDGGGGGDVKVGGTESDLGTAQVDGDMPATGTVVEDKTRGKKLSESEGCGARPRKRPHLALFKKLD